MSKDLSRLIQFMEQGVPFNRYLGFRVQIAEEGFVQVKIPFRKEFIGDPRRPALHGGVFSAIIDACGGLAVWTLFEVEDFISTVDMRVDYLRPGPESDLIAESKVVRMGNRVSMVNTVVFPVGKEEEILAEGRAVYNTRKAKVD